MQEEWNKVLYFYKMLVYDQLKKKYLAIAIMFLELPFWGIAMSDIIYFWPSLLRFLLTNNWFYLNFIELWIPSDVCVLPPDFTPSEVVHIGFSAGKRVYLALGWFLKLVVLYVVAKCHLSLIFLGAYYIVVATQVFRPHYYYLAF